MAIRIRKNGLILCARLSKEKEGDVYLNDKLHYLNVQRGTIVTKIYPLHKRTGKWTRVKKLILK